jgi:DNA-binding NarL/FixJ family response regulator
MSSGFLWSDDDDQRLRSLAQSGLAMRQIALRMNRSHAVIRRHAAKLKIGIASGRNVTATVDRLVERGLKVKGK